jgi:hypothetical protein
MSAHSILSRCYITHAGIIAKKEESPEQALKEFAAIVEQDEPMSDWYAS